MTILFWMNVLSKISLIIEIMYAAVVIKLKKLNSMTECPSKVVQKRTRHPAWRTVCKIKFRSIPNQKLKNKIISLSTISRLTNGVQFYPSSFKLRVATSNIKKSHLKLGKKLPGTLGQCYQMISLKNYKLTTSPWPDNAGIINQWKSLNWIRKQVMQSVIGDDLDRWRSVIGDDLW